MSQPRKDTIAVVNGVSYKYSSEWIHRLESQEHWELYWHQQKLMNGRITPGDTFLEIGVGSGFTANYLRSKGMDVTTIDINENKNPDIVANVVSYSFSQQYDHVLAFEVFEHIPFEEFAASLKKIRKICRKSLFFSVPRNEKILFSAELLLPLLGKKSVTISKLRGKIREPHHFWEVDHNKISQPLLEKTVSESGYSMAGKNRVNAHLFYYFITSP